MHHLFAFGIAKGATVNEYQAHIFKHPKLITFGHTRTAGGVAGDQLIPKQMTVSLDRAANRGDTEYTAFRSQHNGKDHSFYP